MELNRFKQLLESKVGNVKPLINEQQPSTLSSDITSLSKFLKGFDCGNIDNRFNYWGPNPNNEFYSSSMKVNINEIGDVVRDSRCWNYNNPLQWSVFVNGSPDKFASIRFSKTQTGIFFIYKDKYGKRGQLNIKGNENNALKITNEILSSFN